MLLGNLSDSLLPVYQKHCRRHREFYCCLCCWRFRRYTLWISANICVGHVRYCYLFNVVYFLICTLKNCKNKRIFVSNKNVLPGPGRGDWPCACRPSSRSWYQVRYPVHVWHCEVGQQQNRQTSRMLQVPIIWISRKMYCYWWQRLGRNTRMTIVGLVLLESDGRIQFLTPEAEVRTLPRY